MKEELKSLGLSTYESKVLETLFNGKHTLKELIKITGIPPGKIYSVAKGLFSKGLIQSTETRPKKLYVENASKVISQLIKNHELKQQDLITNLQNLATSLDSNANRVTPFFDLGISVEDNKRIQMRTFVEAEKEVLQILNIYHKPKSNRNSKTLWEKQIEHAIKQGVVFKSIYPVNTELPKIIENVSKKFPDKFQIKRLNLDYIRCDIIDGKKVLIKLVHEDPIMFGGVLFIENRKFAQNLRNIFFKFWDDAR